MPFTKVYVTKLRAILARSRPVLTNDLVLRYIISADTECDVTVELGHISGVTSLSRTVPPSIIVFQTSRVASGVILYLCAHQ